MAPNAENRLVTIEEKVKNQEIVAAEGDLSGL